MLGQEEISDSGQRAQCEYRAHYRSKIVHLHDFWEKYIVAIHRDIKAGVQRRNRIVRSVNAANGIVLGRFCNMRGSQIREFY